MSAFASKCWGLVGHNAVDPKGLDELFQAVDVDRERLAELEVAHRDALNELSSVHNELHVAQKDLQRFREREEVHIRPLLGAMLEHLRFNAPSAVTRATLRDRVERAQAVKVVRGSVFTETGDAMAELEKKRAENGELAARVEVLETQLHERSEAVQLAKAEANKRLDAATAELEKTRDEKAALLRDASDMANAIRRLEDEHAELVRVKAANKALAEAFDVWEAGIL